MYTENLITLYDGRWFYGCMNFKEIFQVIESSFKCI